MRHEITSFQISYFYYHQKKVVYHLNSKTWLRQHRLKTNSLDSTDSFLVLFLFSSVPYSSNGNVLTTSIHNISYFLLTQKTLAHVRITIIIMTMRRMQRWKKKEKAKTWERDDTFIEMFTTPPEYFTPLCISCRITYLR